MTTKRIRISGIFLLLTAVLIIAITFGVLHARDAKKLALQREALDMLDLRQGEYDEQTIVLENTSRREAEDLADLFGAELRITENGEFATLTLPENVTVRDAYASELGLEYIEELSPDYYAEISDVSSGGHGYHRHDHIPMRPNYSVNDDKFPSQKHFDYMNMGSTWNTTVGTGITIAVIDTGIDTDHPEFFGRISEYSYNASEDKIVKDCILENGKFDWSIVEDEQGHGTAVSGVIAASMDGAGTVGVAPGVEILVIKAECDDTGRFVATSDLVFGLYYAIECDVDVVNMSFGAPTNHFAAPAQLAVDSDIICVAAAGNDGNAAVQYPAAGVT